MDIKKNKELELKIINLAEEFVQNIIKANLKGQNEKALILKDCQNLILELSGLIHALIQDEEHLESMLNQLIFQKIPEDSVLSNIEDFEEILSNLIQEGVNKYRSSLNEDHSEKETPKERVSHEIEKKDIFEKVLAEEVLDNQENNTPMNNKKETDTFIIQIKNIFPDIIIEKNVNYKGIKLQYYIPEMKIALELQGDTHGLRKIKGFKDLVAEREGLKIIKVLPDYPAAKLKKLIKP